MNGISRFKSKFHKWNMKFNSETEINLISIDIKTKTLRRLNFIISDVKYKKGRFMNNLTCY